MSGSYSIGFESVALARNELREMNGSEEGSGYSWQDIVMILQLAVLIPIMLLVSILDLRPHIERASHSLSNASGDRAWQVNAAIKGTKRVRDAEALSLALPDEAAAARTEATSETAGLSPDDSEANATGPLSLMALDFSLAELPGGRTRLPDAGGPMKVKKPVYSGARLIGDMEITIAGEGQLLLDASEVRAIVGQQPGSSANSSARLPDQGPVSFTTLREMGIDLRYSPNEDVIRINP